MKSKTVAKIFTDNASIWPCDLILYNGHHGSSVAFRWHGGKIPELSAKFANRIARCYGTRARKKKVKMVRDIVFDPVVWRVNLKHQQIRGLAKRLARFHHRRDQKLWLFGPMIFIMKDEEQLCQVWDLLKA